ncbi:MAG: hemerythrin domain-containing protein [Betaproteobacteria bacterium]
MIASIARPLDPPLDWTDALLLGYPAMDKTHESFVQTLYALRSAEDADLPVRLRHMLVHLEEHFGEEDRWMRETEFPPRDCHIDEHAAVLKSVREVLALVEQGGNDAIGRDLADELARWFPGHADYLDSALAAWMCKQRHGGKPVVIRRSISDDRPIP